jgi:hypothetical protein
MTRKDYVLIAEVLKNSALINSTNPFTGGYTYPLLVAEFADALEGTNPLFNRARFLDACGVN